VSLLCSTFILLSYNNVNAEDVFTFADVVINALEKTYNSQIEMERLGIRIKKEPSKNESIQDRYRSMITDQITTLNIIINDLEDARQLLLPYKKSDNYYTRTGVNHAIEGYTTLSLGFSMGVDLLEKLGNFELNNKYGTQARMMADQDTALKKGWDTIMQSYLEMGLSFTDYDGKGKSTFTTSEKKILSRQLETIFGKDFRKEPLNTKSKGKITVFIARDLWNFINFGVH
jgi:hypothetical protein